MKNKDEKNTNSSDLHQSKHIWDTVNSGAKSFMVKPYFETFGVKYKLKNVNIHCD